MSRTLDLPDSVYEALLDAASARGMAPADWIAGQLPRPESQAEHVASPAVRPDREAALERLLQQAVSLGHPTGADNERIDADLAEVYADPNPVPSDPGRT